MKNLIAASLLTLSSTTLASDLGPFRITLPHDQSLSSTINDRDFNWIDMDPTKDGDQIDVFVRQTAPNKIEVSNKFTNNSLRSAWSYSVKDAHIEIRIDSVSKAEDGIHVQLTVTESKCGNIDCADYTGTNKNKVNTKNNYPKGKTFTVGLAFNNPDGTNKEIRFGTNNEKNYRKMTEVMSTFLVNPNR